MIVRDKLKFHPVINMIVMVLAVIVMSSCARLEYKRDFKEGKKQLFELCEKDAGFFVYETAEADGYYDASTDCLGCWQDLIQSNYLYIEFCHEEDESPLSHIIYKKGCYKVYKEKKGSENCHREINQELAKKIYSEVYPPFLKDQCVAVKPLKHPTSQFKFSSIMDKWKSDEKKMKFRKVELNIKDNRNNYILGTYIDYSLIYSAIGHYSSIHCSSLDSEFPIYRKMNFHESILKPVSP